MGGAFSWHNQISYPLGEWPINGKIIISQRFFHQWVLSPTSGTPTWGSNIGSRSPRAFGFEGQWGLSARAPQDQEKQRLHSWWVQTMFLMHWNPRQSRDSIRHELDLPPCLNGSPGKAGISYGIQWGKDTGGRCSREYSLTWALPVVTIMAPRPGPTQQPAGSNAGTP